MIKVEITDKSVVDAFNRLIAFGEDPSGALMAIGEVLLTQTKLRFEFSTDPYGTPWAQNADSTLRKALLGNKRNFTKKGTLRKKGQDFLTGKKPLVGESKSLSTQFNPTVISTDTVTVTCFPTPVATNDQNRAVQLVFYRIASCHRFVT